MHTTHNIAKYYEMRTMFIMFQPLPDKVPRLRAGTGSAAGAT